MRDFVLLLKRSEKAYDRPWGTAVVSAYSETDAAEFFLSKHPEWKVVRVT